MSRMTKRAVSTRVPQDKDEATQMLADLGQRKSAAALNKESLEAEIARIREPFDARIKQYEAEIAELTLGLELWATANRQALTGGKTQSIKLASGVLSWRKAPASVRIAKAADVLAYLIEQGATWCLRIKHEINKDALLADPKQAAMIPGVTIARQGEAFAAEPLRAAGGQG